MTTPIKATFSLLKPKAKLFEEIRIQQPKWWKLLCEDNELYIEIRKDNSINVYFFGGSIARIEYKNSFVAKIHQKYLGDDKPRGKTKKGNDKFEYDKIDLSKLNEIKIAEIKNRIKTDYIRHINVEKPSEKWIQGKIIKENPRYIDSEFQFNKDNVIGKLRIDLIELSDGVLTFIELKGIFDNRLRNKAQSSSIPEIIPQMKKYRQFINTYEVDIIDYYKKLIEIKQTLGLTTIKNNNFIINKNPKLIIANTYKNIDPRREKRISDIEKLLKTYNIDYNIKL